MNPTILTGHCVDALLETGADNHYRCPACAANLTHNEVQPHAMGCAALREEVVDDEAQKESPGCRTAYDFPTHLVVIIKPEADGQVGLYWHNERMVVLPTTVTDVQAIRIVQGMLAAHDHGKKLGRLAALAQVRTLINEQ